MTPAGPALGPTAGAPSLTATQDSDSCSAVTSQRERQIAKEESGAI